MTTFAGLTDPPQPSYAPSDLLLAVGERYSTDTEHGAPHQTYLKILGSGSRAAKEWNEL